LRHTRSAVGFGFLVTVRVKVLTGACVVAGAGVVIVA
jgi:hypothetical protein